MFGSLRIKLLSLCGSLYKATSKFCFASFAIIKVYLQLSSVKYFQDFVLYWCWNDNLAGAKLVIWSSWKRADHSEKQTPSRYYQHTVTFVSLTQRQSDNNVINGSYSNICVITTLGFMVEAHDNNLHMTINTVTWIFMLF